uniref:Retrovirus-related Pol polyprotein from transposon TNT 1-94 n=1 Tax=Cajanus cajan TaxID=3821 RepID=A0A151QZZ5_CAJCA|nr:Retrovirus-related Pol polyprotein from transposon TNT 1-94 [Cajanus cajan]
MNISDIKCGIPELKGDNYKVWKERVLLHLGWMDIDYAIRKPAPPGITETSTPDAVDLYEKWERSNRLSVTFIKTNISAGIRGSVDHHDNVKDLLKAIDEQFTTSDKSLASTLIMQFSSLKLTGIKGVRDHIMRIRDIVAQLKALEVTMSDSFLVHYILCTLPHHYAPFKISYNTHKDKWSINELLTMCVQEEERLMMEEGEQVLLTGSFKKKKNQDNKKGKIPAQPIIKKESKCFFCKKKGHMKKDCLKFKNWLEKKGNLFAFVCYESNMTSTNHNTWWIDSGSTIHVSNTLQGMQNLRKPMGSEQCIYSGSKMSSHVEAVGTCNLVLSSGFILNLEKTFYVPSFSKNLISISQLAPLGFSFKFMDSGFTLLNKSKVIGFGELRDGLLLIYKIMTLLIILCMFLLG